ncbi:helix-turn-helix transcriptional regulator [Pseudomaricurvus alkylphenolicus]|uniref:helix-turn-helix transcriptional regulator n=1 Tax=Pseudomaricurvus alkylphenolicus TaxID=1306991 RepID=UPI001422DB24|nr:AraC family transcriptional regulator [Pseudomaricurvus alkylphenolicus]NIB42429.1 helix-turn-helix transcriptional regulator [Pseudomaricurvus alkylphenolicus]
MPSDRNKPDLRPAIAGDVESFSDKESLESLMRAEHPSPGAEDAVAINAEASLIADGTALQYSLNPSLWEGGIEIYRPFPGISVVTWKFTPKDLETVRQLARSIVPKYDDIVVRLFHTGDVSYRFGRQILHSTESVGLVSYKPDAGDFEQQWQEDQQVCVTHINITEEGEREVWHRLGIMPPALFQKLRTADTTEDRVYELPNTELFKHLSFALVNLPSSGVAHTMMLRLKVGELFCLLGEETIAANGHCGRGDLPFAEIKKLSQARTILEEATGTMPSIAELSAMVGLNRRKLTEGFKQAFGETVAVYALEVRMRKGYQLLNETQLSVQEIAEYCGYGHPHNFTIAFQRRFGCSPSQIRQQK